MLIFPNCGSVYFNGKIIGVGGEGVNGKTVRLRGLDKPYYKTSGEGEAPGQWGFTPLAPGHYHSPFNLKIDIVQSEANPVPVSNALDIAFAGCDLGGQFTNIVFEYAR